MPLPPVPAGQVYRARVDLPLQVLDFDGGGSTEEVLRAGARFQPWEPEPHWRGVKVPVTLGEGAVRFDWGHTSALGHFLAWADFFERCEPAATLSAPASRGPAPAGGAAVPSPRGRELFQVDARGRTALFHAAEQGLLAEVEAMLNSLGGTGTYPERLGLLEVRDRDGLTAAEVAEQAGQKAAAELLRYRAWVATNYG